MNSPEYYTTAGLMKAAGIGRTTLFKHCLHNVGGINAARVKVPGVGLRWEAKKLRKYLAMYRAERAVQVAGSRVLAAREGGQP